MARTSKTVIGGGSGERSDRMMRAADNSGVAAEHARLMQMGQQNVENAQQSIVAAGGHLSRAQDRNQQGAQFDRQMAQREDEMDLEAAKSGFERSSSGKAAGGDRAAKLEQEMAEGAQQPPISGGGIGPLDEQSQNRLRQQGSKGLEDAGGKWVPTEERKQEMRRKDFQADTERVRAEAYADQVSAQIQKSRISGQREQAAELSATLARPINQSVESFDRLLNAEMGKGVVKDSDWTDLEKSAMGGPDADPTLMADIKARTFTPRVQQFARAQISLEAIKYIVRTGDTGNLKVDWTSPIMRQFTERMYAVTQAARSLGPEFAAKANINSIEDKMAFVNTLAAAQVYMGMAMPGMMGGGAPTQGLPPSAGGQGLQREQQVQQVQQGQQGQQPRLQHTPGASDRIEQGRRAGEARRAGNPPPPIGFPDEDTLPRGNSNYRPGPK